MTVLPLHADDAPAEHPAIARARAAPASAPPRPLNVADLHELALAAGADDAAIVSLDHPDLVDERPHILRAMPGAKSVVSLVLRTHAENIRSPQRSVANVEFHRAGHEVDEVAHRIAVALGELGHRAMAPPMAFPMEMSQFPGRTWIVSHKRVAVAAQLGKMGLHRSVIHPRFGSFVLLGSVLTDAEPVGDTAQLDYNPCVSCKLCVAACPVGAIEPDGRFQFSACLDHNYREFMTGFSDFVEDVVDSRNRQDFRDRVPLAEATTRWQSLAFGPSYNAAYCIAVCPAGDELLPRFLARRADFLRSVVKPLTEREETVYVVPGSDAEAHVQKRFPHKQVRRVQSSLRPTSAAGFFAGLALTFQRGPARGWRGTFHFDLTGDDGARGTVTIDDGELEVAPDLVGSADVVVRAPVQVWLDVVSKRRNPVIAVLSRRMRVSGNRSLLDRFARCFPR